MIEKEMLLHEYMGVDSYAGRLAKVYLFGDVFGCKYYLNGNLLSEEHYKGKSEYWAEDAAENYALGVKNV
jgi:hypothetical protein